MNEKKWEKWHQFLESPQFLCDQRKNLSQFVLFRRKVLGAKKIVEKL